MNPLDALAGLLLVIGGFATIVVGAWAAFTHQPELAAGACVALLAFTVALQRLAARWQPAGNTSDTQPWTAHDPGNEQHPQPTAIVHYLPTTDPENQS